MLENEMIKKAIDYKKRIAGSFGLVSGSDIVNKIFGSKFISTKKIDGTLQCLVFEDNQITGVSTSGKVLKDLPCLREAGECLKAYGIQSAIIEAELYAVLEEGKRERVGDVAKAKADPKLHNKLRLAPFDILMLNGEDYRCDNYLETIKKLYDIFKSDLVHPVEYKENFSIDEVVEQYNKWVEEGGAEGIVLHSESPLVFKVKPSHSIDAAVVGYTLGEGEESDCIRDLAIALRREDGLYQIVGVTGGGFSESQKKSLADELKTLVCESDYIMADSRNVAYQMVKPKLIIELSAGDFVTEDSSGAPKENPILEYIDENGYIAKGNTAGVAILHGIFSRVREDKTNDITDIRISQITDLCPFSESNNIKYDELPKSDILIKRIFTKGTGDKMMIQKYVVWKTNKESTQVFPAYVFFYTDFSSGRKEMLKTDMRISSDKEQALSFMEAAIAENVKKGWEEVK